MENTIQKFVTPAASISEALDRYQAVKDFVSKILHEGVDFGKVPGSDKPTLLKPGAEKMTSFFGFSVKFIPTEIVEDWTGKDHGNEPFFYYRYNCQLWRSDAMIAEGEGSCNSWERKYRYRKQERICPACGQPSVIKGKAEYGGGWLCYKKKGGCGEKYQDGDPSIEGQEVGEIKNPDPADLVNTLQKMAQKRALIAPVLIATNTSEYFTQDLEDFVQGEIIENKTKVTRPAHVESINQETGEESSAIEHIKPMDFDWVNYAAKEWGITASEAAKKIGAMKLGKTVERNDFLQIVADAKEPA